MPETGARSIKLPNIPQYLELHCHFNTFKYIILLQDVVGADIALIIDDQAPSETYLRTNNPSYPTVGHRKDVSEQHIPMSKWYVHRWNPKGLS
jgi:hypothetical protein